MKPVGFLLIVLGLGTLLGLYFFTSTLMIFGDSIQGLAGNATAIGLNQDEASLFSQQVSSVLTIAWIWAVFVGIAGVYALWEGIKAVRTK